MRVKSEAGRIFVLFEIENPMFFAAESQLNLSVLKFWQNLKKTSILFIAKKIWKGFFGGKNPLNILKSKSVASMQGLIGKNR